MSDTRYVTWTGPHLLESGNTVQLLKLAPGRDGFKTTCVAYWGWLICGHLFASSFTVPLWMWRDGATADAVARLPEAEHARLELLEFVAARIEEMKSKYGPIQEGQQLPGPTEQSHAEVS